jgi:hypothetical protein
MPYFLVCSSKQLPAVSSSKSYNMPLWKVWGAQGMLRAAAVLDCLLLCLVSLAVAQCKITANISLLQSALQLP